MTATAPASPRRLVLDDTELFELHSPATGKDYELIVGLPPSYASERSRRYPVLYVLDGQWDFTLVHSLMGGLRFDRRVPELVVVGLSYGGERPAYDTLRADDYAPTRCHPTYADGPRGGGGPRFLSLLAETILPLIESRYRVDPARRLLSGSSLGGLFALYALFERPELFESVIAISPSASWDERWLFARERAFRAAHGALHKRLWLGVGEHEWPHFTASCRDFFMQMEASEYEGLALKTCVIAGERHSSVKPEAYNRGLRFVFEPWSAAQPSNGQL
jgi:predicted alpha/beta superfamily hydrolase